MSFARTAVAAAALFASFSSLAAWPPSAPLGTYYFSGECTDCEPTGSLATAILFVGSNGSTFSYSSSNFSLDGFVEAAYLGPINAQGHANAFVYFFPELMMTRTSEIASGWSFKSYSNGAWELGEGFLPPDDNDYGVAGVWTTRPVPEPSTYGLMALGLLGLAAMRRRKQ
jgi:hypothetical protein